MLEMTDIIRYRYYCADCSYFTVAMTTVGTLCNKCGKPLTLGKQKVMEGSRSSSAKGKFRGFSNWYSKREEWRIK